MQIDLVIVAIQGGEFGQSRLIAHSPYLYGGGSRALWVPPGETLPLGAPFSDPGRNRGPAGVLGGGLYR